VELQTGNTGQHGEPGEPGEPEEEELHAQPSADLTEPEPNKHLLHNQRGLVTSLLQRPLLWESGAEVTALRTLPVLRFNWSPV